MIEELAALVEGEASVSRRRGNPVWRLALSAIGGQRAGAELVVDDHLDLGRYTVDLPDAADLRIDVVARAIRTTAAVRRRFGAELNRLRRISFQQGMPGLRTGECSGRAHFNLSSIDLSPTLVIASATERFRARYGQSPPDIEVVVAHELWHLIEAAREVSDYRASVAFRRDVGALFGVATIEHAFTRGGDTALRIADAVSPYAATGPRETTAELFEQLWCGTDNPDGWAVERFADIVERHFPADRPARPPAS